jgi:hypothetical protein
MPDAPAVTSTRSPGLSEMPAMTFDLRNSFRPTEAQM